MWSFSERGSHSAEEGGFDSSGVMLHFVTESILTTDLNKADRTIVPLVVLAINLFCGAKSDDVPAELWKRPVGLGPPGTAAAEEAASAFSFPDRRWHVCS